MENEEKKEVKNHQSSSSMHPKKVSSPLSLCWQHQLAILSHQPKKNLAAALVTMKEVGLILKGIGTRSIELK
ncbi:hypothetical protein OWV82_006932 [Melia azedarach]|uniref:Uncharacterized protein n=1 Tax=Melia azedarach TaxID=155640 RepID=A0ACC1YKK7_MELAZ|nr:hypothetical protein OWV82_006932 [Melia azedarach]